MPFRTTCEGVQYIEDDNVMVITACSSYMYSQKIQKVAKCAGACVVPEALNNNFDRTRGEGKRCSDSLDSLNAMAEDMCQVDDFVLAVVAAIVSRYGAELCR